MPRLKTFDEDVVIEKAKSLFQLKGYEATSMQDLVENLGISRSSLYDTFGDKQNLYLKTLKSYCDENTNRIAKKALLADDPLEYIRHIFDVVIESTKLDKDKKGCYVVNAMIEFGITNPEVSSIIEPNNTMFEKTLEKLIVRAQMKKQISKNKNPKQIAKFLFNTICGIRVNAKSSASIKDLKEIAMMALSVLE